VGRDSSVGIVTQYRLVGPGIESRWGRDFPHPSRLALKSDPASYTMGTGSFPGVKRPERGVDHPPHLAPRLKKEYILLLPLWAFVACCRLNFAFTFTFTQGGGELNGRWQLLVSADRNGWRSHHWGHRILLLPLLLATLSNALQLRQVMERSLDSQPVVAGL
jgi:hypothetical protein